MIVSGDPDYINTRFVKRGSEKIEPVFQELAYWTTQRFETKVLNIYYDTIDDDGRPRLTIIFEYYEEAARFSHSDTGNFDSAKQKLIAAKFRDILSSQFPSKRYDTEKLLVIFTAFEPIARDEAVNNIPEKEIKKFKKELQLKQLWEISRQVSLTTFFFYTDKQIEEYTKNGTAGMIKEKYFKLLKEYDEFDYFTMDTYFIKFDSKENFDTNYQSNWFYYSRG